MLSLSPHLTVEPNATSPFKTGRARRSQRTNIVEVARLSQGDYGAIVALHYMLVEYAIEFPIAVSQK
jgi:hypothetical protein